MGYSMKAKDFNDFLNEIEKEYKIYAPVLLKGKGRFSDTDAVRYSQIKSMEEMEFCRKSNFSPKEVLLPITQVLFYFTEDKVTEPKVEKQKILIFMRSCDINAIKRLDQIYLGNGPEDIYYKRIRENIKFVLMECAESFENCFCVSMGSNKTEDYSMFVRYKDGKAFVECRDEEFKNHFENKNNIREEEIHPKFIDENEINVNIPEKLDTNIFKWKGWKEYSSRCIACGRCNTVCGTCTCFTMQDIFYSDNENTGERRRVWASCQIDKFTDVAGGHSFRQDKGDRMRFKVMHKINDFRKRFGYNMCVGCGRCDDVCPEYISFSNCINKLNTAVEEDK